MADMAAFENQVAVFYSGAALHHRHHAKAGARQDWPARRLLLKI
jgi:hypothetical protein